MRKRRQSPREVRRLVRDLANRRVKVAARAEGRLADIANEIRERLTRATTDPCPRVRWRAAWTLGLIGDPRSFPVLLPLLQDPDPDVPYETAMALGHLGDTRAVEPLVALVRRRDPGNDDALPSAAAMGLVRLGAPAGPARLAVLENGSADARGIAASVLGGIGDETAVQPLARLLEDPDADLRIAGIEALAELGAQHIPLIEKMLDDPEERVRENARYWVRDLSEGAGASAGAGASRAKRKRKRARRR